MNSIPDNFYRYKQMPIWGNHNIPKGLLSIHNTKAGVYGKIHVLKGALKYTTYKNEDGLIKGETTIEAGSFGVTLPQEWHKVEPIGEVQMQIDFFKEYDEKIQKEEKSFFEKFPDKSPHYEVKYLASLLENTNKIVLDIGAGWGRNSLYLANLGHPVTAIDKNIEALSEIKKCSEKYNFNINTIFANLNSYSLQGNFDIIISTVALQFLEKESSKHIITQMQNATNNGGYNLIITPIDAEDIKCPIDFPSIFTEEEIKEYYKDWKIVHFDTMVGKFHRKDQNGHKYVSRFATIIAKKK